MPLSVVQVVGKVRDNFPLCSLQLGPFVDSKHEHIEVGLLMDVGFTHTSPPLQELILHLIKKKIVTITTYWICFTESSGDWDIWGNFLKVCWKYRGWNQKVRLPSPLHHNTFMILTMLYRMVCAYQKLISVIQRWLSSSICALPERHPPPFHLPTASLHPTKPR